MSEQYLFSKAVVYDTYFMPSIEIICDGKTFNVKLLESHRHSVLLAGKGKHEQAIHSKPNQTI